MCGVGLILPGVGGVEMCRGRREPLRVGLRAMVEGVVVKGRW